MIDFQQIADFKVIPVDNANFHMETDGFEKYELPEAQRIQLAGMITGLRETLIANGGRSNATLYRVEFPSGIDGTMMKLKQGGLSTVLKGEEGKITGTASLIQVGEAGAKAALAVFSIMSLVTGQFFLAEINKKLGKISRSIDKILEFLYGDKKAELLAEISFTKYAYQNFLSISSYDQQKQATLIELQHAKLTALRGIEFYLGDMEVSRNKQIDMNPYETQKDVFRAKDCLDLSLQLYIISSVLEIYYSGNHDKDYLDYVKNDIKDIERRSSNQVLECFSTFRERIRKAIVPSPRASKDEILLKIDNIIYPLKQNETPEIMKVGDAAFNSFYKKAEYCIDTSGGLYLKTT